MERRLLMSYIGQKVQGNEPSEDLQQPLEMFDFEALPALNETNVSAQIEINSGMSLDISLSNIQGLNNNFDSSYRLGVPMRYAYVETDTLPLTTYESRGMVIGYDMLDRTYHTNHFPATHIDGTSLPYPNTAPYAFPTITSTVPERSNLMEAQTTWQQLVTSPPSGPLLARARSTPTMSSGYQGFGGASPQSPLRPNNQIFDLPNSGGRMPSSSHPYQTHPLLQNYHNPLQSINEHGLGLFTHPVSAYPTSLYNATSEVNQISEQHQDNSGLQWNTSTIYPSFTTIGVQQEMLDRISERASPSWPRIREEEILSQTWTINDDISLSTFADEIPRTSSPETIHPEIIVPSGGYAKDQALVSPIRNRRNIRHQDGRAETGSSWSTSSGSTSSKTGSFESISSTEFGNRTVASKRRGRMQTDQEKQNALIVRRSGGACENCKRSKKPCSPQLPCGNCQKFALPQSYLASALCYRKNFQQILSNYSDIFGVEEREASIKNELASMHGPRRMLHLGHGLQWHSNVITIDIDPTRVLSVPVQNTKIRLPQFWTSTEGCRNGKTDLKDIVMKKSYAIVQEHLPKISELDSWGRQDIETQAKNWPESLEAKYDLAFLRYTEVTPKLEGYGIVQDTMRIVSLGKLLDSRRPIDHSECMNFLGSFVANRPAKFGIREFNRCKADFQISATARMQLYILAARGIEATLLSLGTKLDACFLQRKNHEDMEFIVGSCLRRLSLEYRQRLERYRSFPLENQFKDRFDKCYYMYTLFTRLYEHWHRESDILPLSPRWNLNNVPHDFGKNSDLMRMFSDLTRLEMQFCQNLNDNYDKFYKMLVVDRAEACSPRT